MPLCWCWHANKRYTGYANVLINILVVLAGLIEIHTELLSSNASEPVSLVFLHQKSLMYLFSCSFSSSLLAIVWSWSQLSYKVFQCLESGLVTIHPALVIFLGAWIGDHPARMSCCLFLCLRGVFVHWRWSLSYQCIKVKDRLYHY